MTPQEEETRAVYWVNRWGARCDAQYVMSHRSRAARRRLDRALRHLHRAADRIVRARDVLAILSKNLVLRETRDASLARSGTQ